MKRVLIVFVILNALLIFGLAGMLVLSEVHPFRPGTSLYPVQDMAEQWRLRFSAGNVRRAEAALVLVELRLEDLAQAQDPDRIAAAAIAVDSALNEAVRCLDAAPATAQGELYDRLKELLSQAESIVTTLEPGAGDSAVIALADKIQALQEAGSITEIIALVPVKSSLFSALPIPFLDSDVEHSVYPLEGGHAKVECADCHPEGLYANTATECAACHSLPADYVYTNHFAGACEDCHTVDSWDPFQFDHVGIIECQSCHLDDNPADHYARPGDYWRFTAQLPDSVTSWTQDAAVSRYPDQCASCHPSTTDWNDAIFDHVGFGDCESCHLEDDTPADHYPGGCTTCHYTYDWETITYGHADAAECLSCHLADSPQRHYVQAESDVWYVAWLPGNWLRPDRAPVSVNQAPATCANCHPNTADWNDVSFDHTGFDDCQHCHQDGDMPEGHYTGQCANCHTIFDWADATFDHTGFTDCQGCHTIEASHYPGQCSDCHTVSDWETVSFDHAVSDACDDCHAAETPAGHYDGSCLKCHSSTGWDTISFDHESYPECATCHSREDHYHLRCANCHNTTNWGEYWFNHSGFRDCADCHRKDAPSDHSGGQCSQCHDINGWKGASADHSDLIDCQSCHIAPANHYSGACLNCHDTDGWHIIGFDHGGFTDCVSCHLTDSPAGHYTGQCSNCHSTDNWWNVINHSSSADCLACHLDDSPADHYPGQCSNCHNTDNWWDAINHNSSADCLACHLDDSPAGHYPGQCSNCHSTDNWWDVTFDHTGVTECAICHEAPPGHWPNECANCHNVTSWDDVTFDHAGYTNCKACHASDRPSDHPRGQCSKCHTTDSWEPIATTTPTSLPPMPTNTPVPPTPTNTPVPPTPTTAPTSLPPSPTHTPVPPTPTDTPTSPPPTPTSEPTFQPPTPTAASVVDPAPTSMPTPKP
jgi:hypothetical protein